MKIESVFGDSLWKENNINEFVTVNGTPNTNIWEVHLFCNKSQNLVISQMPSKYEIDLEELLLNFMVQ